MDKYPALRNVAHILTIIGWVAVGTSAIAVFVGIGQIVIGQISPSYEHPFATSYGTMLIAGAIFLTLFGLLAVAGAGAVGVLIDIEQNTALEEPVDAK